jgi:hypothetical protein
MAGLLDALGETAGDEVALDAQSPCDDERILLGRRFKGAQIPEGVRAVLRECLSVEDDVIGLNLNSFCAHGLLPCGHYERGGEERQASNATRSVEYDEV